jgi:TolB-like protein/class 3 adenylate cyclase/Tfp pilus assembly protein PilF
MAPEVERKLAAILSADVVGYSRLMAEDEASTIRTLTTYRQEITALVGHHRGRVVDAPGDNVLAEFPTALDAVGCAVEIQRVLRARNVGLREERRMAYRIGVHLGDITVEGDRIYGEGVNIAARLEGLAKPGGICISATVHEQVRNKLEIAYHDLGDQKVKNISEQVRVYQVDVEQGRTPASPRPGIRRWVLAGVAAVLVAGAVTVGWKVFEAGPRMVGSPGKIRSLAVLPLDNLSGDPGQAYFADGMTEALIADLARVPGLRVISRTSSMAYRNSGKTLPDIARELNVDAVVEGSVLRVGDRVRITTQLISADSDDHLWSDSYERGLEDVLALQSEVAKAIAGEIELKLAPAQARGGERPVDPEAFEAYLKGRHHWNKRTGADVRKSIEYFETAIEIDPAWALAHSGLAQAYVLLANFDPSVRPRDSMPRARAAAERALEMDDELALAHTALAAVHEFYDWDWDGAEAEFRRALDLDPSDATANFWYAMHRMSLKEKDALEHIERARELDPLSSIIGTGMGIILLNTRQYDRSIETLRETIELDPSFGFAQVFLVRAYAAKGMHPEAVEVAERLARTDSGSRSRLALAEAYAGAGRREDALRILEEIRGSAIYPLSVAYVYAALGEADAAFDWLEKAYERRQIGVVWVRVFPLLDPLRDDSRFDDLLRRLGFPES